MLASQEPRVSRWSGVLLTFCGALIIAGCSTAASPSQSASAQRKMLLYLTAAPASRTPSPSAVGYTDWGYEINGFNVTAAFLIYEPGYLGSFAMASSCASTPNATATAKFTPNAEGPGAILQVTSGTVLTSTTCTFMVRDDSGQKVTLSAGYAGG